MTQPELIKEYIRHKGSICPAKLNDKDRAMNKGWIGSEAGRVCRKLREQGYLESQTENRFEVFYFKGEMPKQYKNECCYSFGAFKTHDPKCPQLEKVTTGQLF